MTPVVKVFEVSIMTSVFSSTAPLINQRKSTRVAFKRRARYIGANGDAVAVRTLDLCADGISIICPHPVPENQLCELSIAANCEGVPTEMKIHGRVVYCILSGTRGFRVGIQFTQVDGQNRMRIDRVISRSIPI